MAGGILVGAGGRATAPSGTVASVDPPPCCYRQSRKCSDNALSGLWLRVGDIPVSNTIAQGGICYYFNPSDLAVDCPTGALHSGYVVVASCADPACPINPCDCPVLDGAGNVVTAPECAENCYPRTWQVTFANVGIPNTCISCPGLTTSYKNNGATNFTAQTFCLTWNAARVGWQYLKDNTSGGPYPINLTNYSDATCTTFDQLGNYFEIDLDFCLPDPTLDPTLHYYQLHLYTAVSLGPWNHFFGLSAQTRSCGGPMTINNLLTGTACRDAWFLVQCVGPSTNVADAPGWGGDMYGNGGTATITPCGC